MSEETEEQAGGTTRRNVSDEWIGRRTLYLQEMEQEAGYWKEQAVNSDAALIEFAKEGIKAAYLMNASAIGLLAIAPNSLKFLPTDLIDFSVPFFLGLLAAVMCNIAAYFAQSHWSDFHYRQYSTRREVVIESYFPGTIDRSNSMEYNKGTERRRKVAQILRYGSIVMAVLSFGAFSYGGYKIIEFWNPAHYG